MRTLAKILTVLTVMTSCSLTFASTGWYVTIINQTGNQVTVAPGGSYNWENGKREEANPFNEISHIDKNSTRVYYCEKNKRLAAMTCFNVLEANGAVHHYELLNYLLFRRIYNKGLVRLYYERVCDKPEYKKTFCVTTMSQEDYEGLRFEYQGDFWDIGTFYCVINVFPSQPKS